MGTTDTNLRFASPVHLVNVTAFEMDVTEVTVAEYQACVDANRCRRVDASNVTGDPPCNGALPDHQNYPVNCVDVDDAAAYCTWVGKRVPSEEEWEYTAQRPNHRSYPWGDREPNADLLNACGLECDASGGLGWNDGYAATAPVGSFPDGKSIDGLVDMAGNVWEWTSSRWCDYPATTCNACSASDPSCSNPCSSCDSPSFVARGGGFTAPWFSEYRNVERGLFNASRRSTGIGFRCAR